MSDQVSPSEDQSTGLIKSTQELGAGLFLMAVAAFAYWQGFDLPRGSLRAMGLLIRSCGLMVAGPASMIFAMLASDEFEWKEATIFSIAMTIICILLFKTLLRLPIPVIGTLLEPIFPF